MRTFSGLRLIDLRRLLSVDYVQGVEMLERKDNVASEEPCRGLIKALAVVEVEEELAARTVVQNEEELGFALKRIVHFDDKRVIYPFLSQRQGVLRSFFPIWSAGLGQWRSNVFS